VSGVRTFFRHCPSCGRRFEIRLVSKKEIQEEAEYRKTAAEPSESYGLSVKESNPAVGSVMLVEGKPAFAMVPEIDDTKAFRYVFKCKHCNHEWSEERFEVHGARPSKDYKGD